MKKINFNLRDATTKEILMFSLLPFGMLTIQTLIGTTLNLYFSDVLGLGMTATGWILSFTKIWDAINDPMMGLIVERTRSKWGKCRPYIIFMVIPVVLVTALLFAPVNFGGEMVVDGKTISSGNFIYAIFAYLLYYTAYTALDIPYQGMMPLIFPDSKVRVRAISFSNIVGSIGTILPTVIFFPIAGMFGKEISQQKTGYFVAALIFAILSGIPIFLSFFGIREKVYIKPERTKYLTGLKQILGNKQLLILLVVAFFAALPNLGAMFLPFYAKWNCSGIFNLPEGLTNEGILIPILSIMSGISYMLSMAIVPPLLRKMEKKTLFIWMSLLGAAADIVTFLIGMYVIPYNTPAGFIVYTLLRFFTNFPVGMSLVLITAIFSDAVDETEMRTGDRLEGTVFSFKSLINKIAIALFNTSVMTIVQRLGYDADKMKIASNDMTIPLPIEYKPALDAIFFMLTALGGIGLILQALPMFFYHFDEKTFNEDIAAFRAEKEARLQKELEDAAREQGMDPSQFV